MLPACIVPERAAHHPYGIRALVKQANLMGAQCSPAAPIVVYSGMHATMNDMRVCFMDSAIKLTQTLVDRVNRKGTQLMGYFAAAIFSLNDAIEGREG